MSSEEAPVVGLAKAVSAPGTSLEESQRAYAKWAQTYEQVHVHVSSCMEHSLRPSLFQCIK